ncbi:hydrolase [Dictyobacter arantiisoli]|uniref:Hydrolase n=1 Tax=Dictyobacter arantiisoli TaxID=2014874 RepID=A0A5A5TA85_9CHLR|nr:hydrolase [Dictyobacter arantiisoli]
MLQITNTHAASSAYVRLNQVGYITGETKQAILLASGSDSGASFSLVNTTTGITVYSGTVGSSKGSWSSTFPDTYLIDFSSFQTAGSYSIHVSGSIKATSPTFKIDSGANLYTNLLSNALFFYQSQRDGANVNSSVLNRQPSHLTDQTASIYSTPSYNSSDTLQGSLKKIGGPIDVSGGWFDAGDYVKFVETASYTDAIMLFAARQYPALLTGGSADINGEGKYGLDWLQKMWNNSTKTLYYQVGIGDGNGGSILGDHDQWRLPQADDKLSVSSSSPAYYIKYRPVFEAGSAGAQISPNLAGRLAADFGLCYQLYHTSDPTYANQCLSSGETVFDLAKTSSVSQLLTTAPNDYYPETEWRDDMELGATELYNATALGNLPSGLAHSDPSFYLSAAAKWANAYITGPNDGSDSLNLYDVSGLAHYELYNAITRAGNPSGLAVSQASLLSDLKAQLDAGTTQAKSDPFGFGIAYAGADATPHALGYALEASFYDQLAGVSTYKTFGLTQRNWALGSNAWGSSFIVGAGSTFPNCMQSQIANLAGSLTGGSPLQLGAVVDGPSATSNFSGLSLQSGMKACPPSGGDIFKTFTGKGARYYDNVVAWPSTEPADDYTALSILVFAQQI